jgi:hypothetical protein
MSISDERDKHKLRRSHVWPRSGADFYVEPAWVSERLFAVESFIGEVIDPCCGFGTVVEAARRARHCAEGWDIVDRGFSGTKVCDFLTTSERIRYFVGNPPFNIARHFALHALALARHKVAIVFPTARLNAARWLDQTPLARIWLLTPRPSMPPGEAILRGEKPGGGKVDFCWLVFDVGYCGASMVRWLRRDAPKTFAQALAEFAVKK